METTPNPWKTIPLDAYEAHMSMESVQQLQRLDEMMKSQIDDHPAETLCILGIAGGNGLRHVDPARIRRVYGVDINPDYLATCTARYPALKGCFTPVCADLTQPSQPLPAAEAVIADLFVEYVGCDNFARAVQKIGPRVVSCIVQINTDERFVSQSPYAAQLQTLDSVHETIDPERLTRCMEAIGYRVAKTDASQLPDKKRLYRIDFTR